MKTIVLGPHDVPEFTPEEESGREYFAFSVHFSGPERNNLQCFAPSMRSAALRFVKEDGWSEDDLELYDSVEESHTNNTIMVYHTPSGEEVEVVRWADRMGVKWIVERIYGSKLGYGSLVLGRDLRLGIVLHDLPLIEDGRPIWCGVVLHPGKTETWKCRNPQVVGSLYVVEDTLGANDIGIPHEFHYPPERV